MKPTDIFKAGTHRAMDGREIAFSEADLQAVVDAYDPKLHRAPFVIGHPKHDDPAYGWAGRLFCRDGRLYADPEQVEPSFAEGVRSGRWPNRSASFYLPDSPANPKPGHLYLRHVGFLGAQPPAVKGLHPVSFGDGEAGVVCIDFGEGETRTSRLWRNLRDFFLTKFGQETADQVIPDWELERLSELARETPATEVPEFGEDPQKQKGSDPFFKKEADVTKDKDLEKRLADLEAREAAFAERQRRRDAEFIVKELVDGGRLTPAQAEGLAEFMATLEDGIIEFGEGDEKTATTQAAWLRGFLGRLPKQVEFSELGNGEAASLTADDIADLAVAYQEEMRGKGVVLTTTQAVARVTAKSKE
ncbi:MAG: hypothetical protein RBR13_11620 [Tenuifilaceae bacterium]|nr:hypothetical protein [Tenuifilaceae bacterium]